LQAEQKAMTIVQDTIRPSTAQSRERKAIAFRIML